MPLNRNGYLLTYKKAASDTQFSYSKTYACTNLIALEKLILRLTGRSADTFPLDSRYLPKSKDFVIAYPLHIWS